MTPARIADSRTGLGQIVRGQTANLQVTGSGGVPSTEVSAVALNITATGAAGTGYVTVYPTGASAPSTSNLNFVRGQTVAQTVIAAVSADGRVTLASATPVDLVVDVEGYFSSVATATAAGTYLPVAPARIADTRSHFGANAPGAGGDAVVTVAGRGGVPATGAIAAMVNITVTQPTSNGYVTAFPHGQDAPATSTINFVRGQTLANRAIVALGSDGAIDLRNASGSTQLVIDVEGYFTDGTQAGGGYYVPLPPVRHMDTRGNSMWSWKNWTTGEASLPLAGNDCDQTDACGRPPIPFMTSVARPVAAVLTMTAVAGRAGGYLTAYASGSTPPSSSDVNFDPGQIAVNLGVVPLGSDGSVVIKAAPANGDENAVVDVTGYFARIPTNPTPKGVWIRPFSLEDLDLSIQNSDLSIQNMTAAGPIAQLYADQISQLHSDGTVWRFDGFASNAGVLESDGQVDPGDLHDITTVQSLFGNGNAIGLRSDGTVWTWGFFPAAPSSLTFQVKQVPGLTNIVRIGSATGTGFAVDAAGALWAWGQNTRGATGTGTSGQVAVPVKVPGPVGATSIGGNDGIVAAVDGGGALWEWGSTSQAAPQLPSVRPSPCVAGSIVSDDSTTILTCPDGRSFSLRLPAVGSSQSNTYPMAIDHVVGVTLGGLEVLRSDGTVWRSGPSGWTAVNGLTGIVNIGESGYFDWAVAGG